MRVAHDAMRVAQDAMRVAQDAMRVAHDAMRVAQDAMRAGYASAQNARQRMAVVRPSGTSAYQLRSRLWSASAIWPFGVCLPETLLLLTVK